MHIFCNLSCRASHLCLAPPPWHSPHFHVRFDRTKRDSMKRRNIVIVVGCFGLIIAAGVVLIFTIPTRDLADDTYARICEEITQKRLKRPSSMEIVSAWSGLPKERPQSEVEAESYGKFTDMPATRDLIIQSIRDNYKNSQPWRQVPTYIEYSAQNGMGGSTRGITACEFQEEPDYHGGYESHLTEVTMDNDTFQPGNITWFVVADSRELAADRVRPGFSARLKYYFSRSKTK